MDEVDKERGGSGGELTIVRARIVSPPGARVTETVLELSEAAQRGLTTRGSIPPVRSTTTR